MGVRIEAAAPADCVAVVRLWQATGLTRPWNDSARDFDTALANPTSTVLLAWADDALAGSVMAGFDGHRGWVYYLAVAPDLAKRGIGKALMEAAEDWLRGAGCARLRLMVRGDNLAARGFYQAIGYTEQDVVTMGRSLMEQ